MMFFVQNLSAQKVLKKSFSSKANKIIAEFDFIDQVEIVTTDMTNQIVVISKSEEITSSNISIEEVRDKLFIKTIGKNVNGSEIAVIKLTNIRPVYASYQIKIPSNMNVDVSIVNGNFISKNFHGNLQLKMEEGTIKIDSFKGDILVNINIGNVSITEIEDCKINVHSNLGKVQSSLNLKKGNKTYFYGVVGNKKNTLNINAMLANIHLKSALN
jgi:hypothetical protein